MIAVTGAYPGHAGGFGFLDGELRGAAHHQVSHGVVAVEQCRGRILLNRADAGPRIDPATLDPLHVLRQAEDTMTIGAAGVRLGHQCGRAMRIRGGKTHAGKYPGDEFSKIGYGSTGIKRRKPHAASLPSWYRIG